MQSFSPCSDTGPSCRCRTEAMCAISSDVKSVKEARLGSFPMAMHWHSWSNTRPSKGEEKQSTVKLRQADSSAGSRSTMAIRLSSAMADLMLS